jgi:hypothetical protein
VTSHGETTHAGVLVLLALIVQLYGDGLALDGVVATVARSAVPAAALLIPGGFFPSVTGREVTEPNRSLALLYVGVAVLGAGVVALAWRLLTA